jgi:putative ABC transport system permease protein
MSEAVTWFAAWRVLWAWQWRDRPMRLVATVLAIALGVTLGASVYLINAAALAKFDLATRRLVGEADLVVRAPAGLDEQWFARLARDPAIAAASPVVELSAVPARDSTPLPLLGLDPFRAAALQPALIAALGDGTALFARDAVALSAAAAARLHAHRGDSLSVSTGGRSVSLRVIEVLPTELFPQPLGIMDIAAAQWTFDRLGQITRVDLRSGVGVDVDQLARRLQQALPPGVAVRTPALELARGANATRAYRVNLTLLALVALLTGAFVVFSTQTFAVLQRRVSVGLLRALGVTQGGILLALLAEGATLGAIGGLLGSLAGTWLAAIVPRWFENASAALPTIGALLSVRPWTLVAWTLAGTVAAIIGTALPAREAAVRAPARALRAGDVEPALARRPLTLPGLALLCLGALTVTLPAVDGLPLWAYLAIAQLLVGAVLLAPWVLRTLLAHLPRSGSTIVNTAIAGLRGRAGLATLTLASILVSFSLAVAMNIMVHSFRDSFDRWLIQLLPADLQLRARGVPGSAHLSASEQQGIAAEAGVLRAEFRVVRELYLRPDREPVTLIARPLAPSAGAVLPLVDSLPEAQQQPGVPQVWVSEAASDLYGLRVGTSLDLPLAGRRVRCRVAGVWRDYVRQGGSVVMSRADYTALTGDDSASEGSIWLAPGIRDLPALRARLQGTALELLSSSNLHQRSMLLFDDAFAVTYGLEAVAVFIGLLGVGIATSTTTLARRAQFGMLRHIGLLQSQMLGMIAIESTLLSLIAVVYGLALGTALSWILIYVVNRQSFHWSIDLSMPWDELLALTTGMVAIAAITSLWSGRSALNTSVVRAVREDW